MHASRVSGEGPDLDRPARARQAHEHGCMNGPCSGAICIPAELPVTLRASPR